MPAAVTIRGHSQGLEAGVNEDLRLEVDSVERPFVSFASAKGDTYAAVFHRTLSGTSEQAILHVKNDNPRSSIHICKVILSSNGAAVRMRAYSGATRTSGGASVTPVNQNTAASDQSQITAYDNSSGALTLSTAAGFLVRDITAQVFLLDLEGSVILGPGKQLGVTVQGTSGDEIAINVVFVECE